MKDYKQLSFLPGFSDYEGERLLGCSLAGMWMRTPVMTASGTFGYGREYPSLRGFSMEVVGAIVLKSVTRQPRAGNPEPRFVETPGGLINSIGLQNIGVEALVKEELPKLRELKTNIIVSIAASSVEEYAEVASILKKSDDFEAVEVNISCPNVKKQGMLFSFDPIAAAAVTRAVKTEVSEKPVIMKLSPNAPDIVATALACAQAGADAVSLVNTFTALAIDIEKRRPILKRNFGGLSGPGIKPIALAMVAKVASAFKEQRVQKQIVGIGGIQTGRDAIEYIVAGASAVGVGTSIFYDPTVLQQIVSGLRHYCQEHGLAISQIVGTLEMNSDNDEANTTADQGSGRYGCVL
jgi:dihydroorotate dehydrogenase (NAD+) catalytic subunit